MRPHAKMIKMQARPESCKNDQRHLPAHGRLAQTLCADILLREKILACRWRQQPVAPLFHQKYCLDKQATADSRTRVYTGNTFSLPQK